MLNTLALNTWILNAPAGAVTGGVVPEPETPANPNITLDGLHTAAVFGDPSLQEIVTVTRAIGSLRVQVRSPAHALVQVSQLQGLSASGELGQPILKTLSVLRGLRINPVLPKPQIGATASASPLVITLRPGEISALMADVNMQGLRVSLNTGELCMRSIVQVPPLFIRTKQHMHTFKTEVPACHP